MKKTLLTTVLLLSFLFQGNAQRFDYENTSKLFFGINVGRTWHTSDVENVTKRFPLGAGFVLGGSINQDYGKAVSFDIRLRYLGGNWYGQDSDTTGAIQNNTAVNELYDTLGYAVQNFKSTQHRLALELSIHANRFKEKTGFDPYIFAGIGVTGTRTKGDLLQKTGNVSNGTIYPYNESPNGNIIDKDYTVALDKNEAGESYEDERFEANILPSLGVGIGYYFNSRFSIGLEHKSTFFLADYFDGTTVNQDGMPSDNIKNDIYHYSGIYLKWYFKASNHERTPPKEDAYIPPTPPNQVIEDGPETTEPGRKRPPVVTFNNPSSTPFRTSNPSFAIRANVQYVKSARDLTFTHNGADYSTFIYNPMSRTFESTVNLEIGENVFILTGVNADGIDNDRVVIIYERIADDRANPPVVNIVDPAVRPHTVNQLNYIVKADIQNIKARNQLAVTFNEVPFSDFSFSPNGNINFNANLNLNPGVNTFKIVGTNEVGMDLDETVIIYTREATDNTGYPPVVDIITPNTNPYTTAQATEQVVAKVDHVNTKQQIDVKINSVSTTNFTFDAATKRVKLNTNLSLGTNTITINAINPYGDDTDKTQIIFRRSGSNSGDAGTPPTVNILTPNSNPFMTNETSANIIAELENIDTKSQIEVKINGASTAAFTYNNATQLVQLNASLIAGNNSVNIKATNAYGDDLDDIQIVSRRGEADPDNSGTPPTVRILTPNANPFATAQPSVNIFAEVLNVTSKSQIEVKVNGSTTANFIYNSMTNRVQLNTSLVTGNNNVSIKATNDYGSDLDAIQIVYRRGGSDLNNSGTPPKVKILIPNTNPYTTNQEEVSVIAEVRNVNSKSQIEVQVNGNLTSNFSYNNSTKRVQLNTNLSFGNNTVSIKATNIYGNDTDNIQIIYRRGGSDTGSTETPPTVNILTPNTNPFTTSDFITAVVAKVQNIDAKQQIEVKVNGANTSDFIFNNTTKLVQFNTNLTAGSNIVSIKVTNTAGVDTDDSQIIHIKKPVGKPPVVSFIAPNDNSTVVEQRIFKMIAKVENITNKSNVALYFNGNMVDPNKYTFNSSMQTISYPSDLSLGINTYTVTGENNFGTDQATVKIERKTRNLEAADIETNDEVIDAPCIKPTMVMTSPKSNLITVEDNIFNISGQFRNIGSATDIEVFFNGKKDDSFIYNGMRKSFLHKLDLQSGENTYLIILTNECGTIESEYTINYEAPQSCGVKIDLGSIASDFCLITASGTITRDDLMTNLDFEYNGSVKYLYFKAGENGTATVNNADYTLVDGTYYYFSRNITVDIGRNKPGSVGQWNICVLALKPPLSGQGSSKPKSPCETAKDNSKTQESPEDKGTPIIKDKPTTNEIPTLRENPTRNNENTNPSEELNEPVERNNINTRNPRGGR